MFFVTKCNVCLNTLSEESHISLISTGIIVVCLVFIMMVNIFITLII